MMVVPLERRPKIGFLHPVFKCLKHNAADDRLKDRHEHFRIRKHGEHFPAEAVEHRWRALPNAAADDDRPFKAAVMPLKQADGHVRHLMCSLPVEGKRNWIPGSCRAGDQLCDGGNQPARV